MAMFQYLTESTEDGQKEVWVCESCRKKNNNFILKGKWRLIGRSNNPQLSCMECNFDEKEDDHET